MRRIFVMFAVIFLANVRTFVSALVISVDLCDIHCTIIFIEINIQLVMRAVVRYICSLLCEEDQIFI